MIKKTVFALCMSLVVVACGSEVRRLKETEYLRTQTGKPVVYPEGLGRPTEEKTFIIPDLPKGTQASEAPELLALPPRLAGVDLSEDEDDEKKPEDKEGGKPGDEGFLEPR
ncbi:MAG TPA: hypothetical protein VFX02_06435 [Gammaproteobacteria bacterium]|nr:hypothetical protein [Gammaproteobacteria bacterium]